MEYKKRGLNNAFKNVVMPVKIDYINSNKSVLEQFINSNYYLNMCNACKVNIHNRNIYKDEYPKITMKNSIDKLEFDREQTEIQLQKISNACDEIEKVREEVLSKGFDFQIKEMFDSTIKNFNKEYEYTEQILEEINTSLEFERDRLN